MRDAFEACTCEACSSAVTDALMLACKCICDGGTYMCHRHMYMPSAAMVLLACGKRLAPTEPIGETLNLRVQGLTALKKVYPEDIPF